jgi:choline dehydrogenase-like flavoprotein
MNTITTDVLVVGSGFGAAAPALRLSQAGCKVLMIEKGKNVVPQKDFELTQDPKYLLRYLKGMSSDEISFGYAEGLGGGSGFYEMVSLRAPSKVFDQVDENGHRLWPAGIDRKVLDPYYDLAEEMLHVEQIAVEEIPKSGVVFSLMMKNLGYTCDRAKYAVKGCVGSGYCIAGCIFGAKQSLHLNYLPQAKQSGTEIRTDLEAVSIRPLLSDVRSTLPNRNLSALPHMYTVHCRTLNGKEDVAIQAKVVILGGGTVGTARLLLNSRENLRFLSGHVGNNVAFNGSVKAAGLLPEGFIEGDMLSGRSHPGMISYHFFDSLGITISTAKPLPLQVVATARLVLDGGQPNPSYWGKANVELMKLYRRRMIVLYALGLTPPQAEIRQTGQNFKPHLNIDAELRMYYKHTKALLHSILLRNGCKTINVDPIDGEGKPYEDIHFGTTHMIGSCRMADQKGNGVTDAFGEVFDYSHLFVTDGAAIPTSLAVNSSLTILANAERIASYLARSYGRMEREKIVVRLESEPSVPQQPN